MTRGLQKFAYEFCVKRDGERCKKCGRVVAKISKARDPVTEVYRLVVHHIDNDRSNNPMDGTNWQLLCDSCHSANHPRGLGRFSRHGQMSASDSNLGGVGKTTSSKSKGINEKSVTRERERERNRLSPQIQHAEMEKAEIAELFFREYIPPVIEKEEPVREDHLVDAAAEEFHRRFGKTVSQQALSRYLDKLCNPINGEYQYLWLDDKWHVQRRKG